MTWWPFVFRQLYDDKVAQLAEVRAELVAVKTENRRVLDEINYRSTGFHVYPEFERKDVEVNESAAVPQVPRMEATGVEGAIEKVGTRMSAIRRQVELDSLNKFGKTEAEFRDGREAALAKQATETMEKVLRTGKDRAAQVQA